MRDAFLATGHNAWSCDIEASESRNDKHIQMDIFRCLSSYGEWDLIIAHPPCTAMAVCGNGTYAGTQERHDAQHWTYLLFHRCLDVASRVCFENPVSTLARVMPMKAKYFQPWQFGHPETKKTGLWLHNLPPLEPTDNVYDHMMTLPKKERHKIWYASPGEDRGKERSRFYPGVAAAMAEQWGSL